MKLRDYQLAAVEATIQSLRGGKSPVISIPAGGGKSAIIAALVDRFRAKGGNTLIVTHSKEIVTQNVSTLERYSHLDEVGVYAAGLDRYEIGESATYCTIQSIYRNLKKLPHDLSAIIVDECHLVAPVGSDAKMYNALMDRLPNARRIGASATPYRLDGGLVYHGEGVHFDDLAIEVKIRDLVEAGYLAPLVGISATVQLDLKGVHKTNGDFDVKEVDERITRTWLAKVLEAVKRLASDRKTILLFAPTVRSAKLAADISNSVGISAEYVHGGDAERGARLKRWEAGEFRMMANCQILTTGYDLPRIDAIVDCSPTESLGKHIQKLGRGTRLFHGKTDCLILDVAGNLMRLGGISSEADFTEERKDGTLQPGAIRKPAVKAPRTLKRADLIDAADPMGGNSGEFGVLVKRVQYVVIGSRKQLGKNMVMVVYEGNTEHGGYPVSASKFLCVEYSGWARVQAEEWFRKRGAVAPYSAQAAQVVCWGLPMPRRIIARRNGQYTNVHGETL